MKTKPHWHVNCVTSEDSYRKAIDKERTSKKPSKFLLQRYERDLEHLGYYYFMAGKLVNIAGITMFEVKHDSRDHDEWFSTGAKAVKAAKKWLKDNP